MNRSEYMAATLEEQPQAHRAYYGQFVNDMIKKLVISHFTTEMYTGEDVLKRSFNMDHAFNTDLTPLKQWDILGSYIPLYHKYIIDQMKECGDYLTQAGEVCILKEAARQVVEEELAREA